MLPRKEEEIVAAAEEKATGGSAALKEVAEAALGPAAVDGDDLTATAPGRLAVVAGHVFSKLAVAHVLEEGDDDDDVVTADRGSTTALTDEFLDGVVGSPLAVPETATAPG
jgi:hypothetical protein